MTTTTDTLPLATAISSISPAKLPESVEKHTLHDFPRVVLTGPDSEALAALVDRLNVTGMRTAYTFFGAYREGDDVLHLVHLYLHHQRDVRHIESVMEALKGPVAQQILDNAPLDDIPGLLAGVESLGGITMELDEHHDCDSAARGKACADEHAKLIFGGVNSLDRQAEKAARRNHQVLRTTTVNHEIKLICRVLATLGPDLDPNDFVAPVSTLFDQVQKTLSPHYLPRGHATGTRDKVDTFVNLLKAAYTPNSDKESGKAREVESQVRSALLQYFPHGTPEVDMELFRAPQDALIAALRGLLPRYLTPPEEKDDGKWRGLLDGESEVHFPARLRFNLDACDITLPPDMDAAYMVANAVTHTLIHCVQATRDLSASLSLDTLIRLYSRNARRGDPVDIIDTLKKVLSIIDSHARNLEKHDKTGFIFKN